MSERTRIADGERVRAGHGERREYTITGHSSDAGTYGLMRRGVGYQGIASTIEERNPNARRVPVVDAHFAEYLATFNVGQSNG